MSREKTQFSQNRQPAERTPRGKSEQAAILKVFREHHNMPTDEVTNYLVKIALGKGVRMDEDPLIPVIWRHFVQVLYPTRKQQSPPVEVPMPEGATPAERADAVIAAAARGEISVEAMQAFTGAIKQALEIREVTELAERLEKLEQIIAERQK